MRLAILLSLLLSLAACSSQVTETVHVETASGPAAPSDSEAMASILGPLPDELIVGSAPPAAASAPTPIEEAEVAMAPLELPPGFEPDRMRSRSIPQPSDAPVITPADMADNILSQMLQASLVFTIPESSRFGSDLDAELRMSLTLSESELRELNPDATLSAGIVVSRIVEARLQAPDFEVISSSGDRQALSATEDTVWVWQLRPKSAGSHKVRLSVLAAVDVAGERTQRLVRTFDKTITVEITPTQLVLGWLQENWQWLIGTLILPFAIWAWNSRRGKGA